MDLGSLTEALERATLHALLDDWDRLNSNHFHALLRRPVLELGDSASTLGRWDRARRTITIARALVVEQPWLAVVEVLKHAMAHQFVSEVLNVRDESAHGPAFAEVCRQRGFDPAATGLPDVEPGSPRHKLIERVSKLLALATSPNRHEAEVAMATAQRLILEHNLAVHAAGERRFVSQGIHAPVARLEEALGRIGSLLVRHFFVKVVICTVWDVQTGRTMKVQEATGTPENVAMAEYVCAFLDRTADALWREHKARNAIRGNRDRRAFRTGVIEGFESKLDGQRSKHREQGLVWIGDPALERHYQQRYPRLYSTRSRETDDREARQHGHAAGQSVVLSRPVESSGSNRGRLLGDGRG